jgi:plastocyanin
LHVTISGFTFHPDHFVVAPGATLTVTNHDPQPHTFTSTAGEFNTGDITQGQTVTLTAPRKKGTYPFKCTVHPFMTGSFQVR